MASGALDQAGVQPSGKMGSAESEGRDKGAGAMVHAAWRKGPVYGYFQAHFGRDSQGHSDQAPGDGGERIRRSGAPINVALRAVSRCFKHSASRGAKAIVATILITAAGMSLAAAENDCKTSFFGLCTNRFTESEQVQINARRWLEAQLRDPARSGPALEQRLRKQVRYSNGLLLITDPILHGVTTLPATTTWTISCDTWSVSVTFASTEVELVPIGTNIAPNACYRISGLLGEAVLRLTSGQ